jgi:transcriptional antiterminator RfaH
MPDLNDSELAWYCFQAQPKREHVAARILALECAVEAFCPRIAYNKLTRRGKVRFVEPLFPGYLFVHAELRLVYRQIMATKGVRRLVSYGEQVPRVPACFISELRAQLAAEDCVDVPEPELTPGARVRIIEGPFRDWEAVVAGLVPARDRVRLLLEFLGQQLPVELRTSQVHQEISNPKASAWLTRPQ